MTCDSECEITVDVFGTSVDCTDGLKVNVESNYGTLEFRCPRSMCTYCMGSKKRIA